MKKQFILSVIMSIIMLFTVNGQSLVNQQSRFTKRINNNEKVELKEPELKPLDTPIPKPVFMLFLEKICSCP